MYLDVLILLLLNRSFSRYSLKLFIMIDFLLLVDALGQVGVELCGLQRGMS